MKTLKQIGKGLGSNNSVHAVVLCKTDRQADRLYWNSPASARSAMFGTKVYLDCETKKSTIQTLRQIDLAVSSGAEVIEFETYQVDHSYN